MNITLARKILACLVSVAMVVSLTPICAYADLTAGESPALGGADAPTLQEGLFAAGEPDTVEAQEDRWASLQDAIDNAHAGAIIPLTGDTVNTANHARIKVSKSITIDLAGFTLDRNLGSKRSDGNVIEVMDSATLTIRDSSANKTGKITGGISKYGGGVYVNKGTILNFESGTIAGNHATSEGGGIYVKGTVNMSGGTIEDNTALERGGGIYVDGTLDMTGGTIIANGAKGTGILGSGGGIYVASDGAITLSGAEITKNEADRLGGGIYTCSHKAVTTMANCLITYNKARSGSGGGLCMTAKTKSLTITNTNIEHNVASNNDGGGIYLDEGSITMTGGSLSYNSAVNGGGAEITGSTSFTATGVNIGDNKAESGAGGGVWNSGTTKLENCAVTKNSSREQGGGLSNGGDAGELTLDNCTVSNNSTEGNGGGVYSNKTLKINGGIIGKVVAGGGDETPGNTAGRFGGGVFIDEKSGFTNIQGKLVVEGNSTPASKQEVYFNTAIGFVPSGPLAEGARIGVTLKGGTGVFTLQYSYYNSGVNPATYFFSPEGLDVGFDSSNREGQITSAWQELQDLINEKAGSGHPAELTRDYTAAADDTRLTIPTTGAVTINLAGHTINFNRVLDGAKGNVIEMPQHSVLTIEDTSSNKTGTITGGFSDDPAGGIHVGKNATLTITGGNIYGNKTAKEGGGIFVEGTLNMTGGTIENNAAGAGYDPGALIKGLSYGGGIFVSPAGSITLNNVAITRNSAVKSGGGIRLESGASSTIITDCTFSYNTSRSCGGGLSMDAKGKALELVGTRFEHNYADDDGGGIYLQNGGIALRSNGNQACTLAENIAANDGGGVKVIGASSFIATGAVIDSNRAGEGGGGLKNYGTMELTECTIVGNNSGKQGGGVYNDNKDSSPGNLTLNNCIISNNSSQSGGGGGVYSDKNLTINGGTIGAYKFGSGEESPGNSAQGLGGGVLIDSGENTTVIKGSISMRGNTATWYGNDLYLENKEKLTLGGAITGTNIGSIDMRDMGVFTEHFGTHHGNAEPSNFFCTDDGAIPAVWADGHAEARLKSFWKDLQDEINAKAAHGGTVTLRQGYTASADDTRLTIPENGTVTINLAGHTINRNRMYDVDKGDVIEVPSGTTLTIEDSTASGDNPGNGKITGGYSDDEGGGIHVAGTLNVTGGTITGNKTAMDGGGIFVSGTLNMTGGAIVGNSAGVGFDAGARIMGSSAGGGICVASGGKMTLSRVTITNNMASKVGGGIYLAARTHPATITNCLIADNSSHEEGGGLYVNAKGDTLTMTDTSIEGNSANDIGGGIYLNWGTVVMTGGSVSGNISLNGAGGIEVASLTNFSATSTTVSGNLAEAGSGGGVENFGTTVLTDCQITGNTSKDDGGGVCNCNSGGECDLTLMNCVVSGNETEGSGGGVYSNKKLAVSGGTIGRSFTGNGEEVPGNRAGSKGGGIFIGKKSEASSISGDLMVLENTADVFGDDVYLPSGKKLTLKGALTDRAAIGVCLQDGAGVITSGYKDHNGKEDPKKYFVTPQGCNPVLNAESEVEITTEWATLKDRIEHARNGESIPIDKDYAACSSDQVITIPANTSIDIDLCGHTLNRNRETHAEDGQVFHVLGTLTIRDSSTGQSGTIRGGWGSKSGGGIKVGGGGTLNLVAGTITGNRAVEGAGISVAGTLNMTGGVIEGNEAQKSTDPLLPVYGGWGAGINMGVGGTLNLEGGTITGNRAVEWGGGIASTAQSTINVKGSPVVRRNRSSNAGSDMYLLSGAWINVVGALADGAHVSIAMKDEQGAFTNGYDHYNSGKDPARYFASTEGFSVILENGEAALGQGNNGETDHEKPFINPGDQINDDPDALCGQNWMSGISGERYLNEVNTPGVHDAGMCSIQELKSGYLDYTSLVSCIAYETGAYYATTQNLYINQQLAAGARQLDIRLNDCYKKLEWYGYDWEDDGKNLWLCHGTKALVGTYYATDENGHLLSFSTVLDWVKDFLTKHPTETVILNLRPETFRSGHDGAIQARAKSILKSSLLQTNQSTGECFLYKESGSKDYFAPYKHTPQLKDCRGKVVLLPDSDEFVNIVGGFQGEYFVKDYEAPTDFKLTAPEKVAEIPKEYAALNDGSKMIPADADTRCDYLWYWELNCTGQDQGDFNQYVLGGPAPVDNGAFVNPRLIGDDKLFGKSPGEYIGWVRLDDFQATFAESIWRTNFYNQQEYCTVTVKSGLNDPNYPDQTYQVLKGTKIIVPGNIYKKLERGKYFGSWVAIGKNPHDTWTCDKGDPFTVDEDVTFTAQWLEEGKVPVSIVWQDADNADKLRPHSMDLKVTEVDEQTSEETTVTVTLKQEQDWSGIVTGVVKDIVPDWELIVPTEDHPNGQDKAGQYRYEKTHEGGEGYTFTLIHSPQSVVEASGTVVWDDDNNAQGNRPDSVTIHLFDNGVDTGRTATANADGRWSFSFGELPQYVDGKKVEYKITEDAIANYSTTIDGFTVTNKASSSGHDSVNVIGNVVWDDEGNAAGVRPSSVMVRLRTNSQDGEVVDSREVMAGDQGFWDFCFEGVPFEDGAGKRITYVVTIDKVTGLDGSTYTSVVENITPAGSAANSVTYAFRITNTLVINPDKKKPAELTEEPVAYDLTYDGEPQLLVKAGSGKGGAVVYALGDADQSALSNQSEGAEDALSTQADATVASPDPNEYKPDLPTGIDAGTYNVWYYVKGDAYHTDTTPECVQVMVGKLPATITVDSASKVQGAADPTFTGTVEGLVVEGDLGQVTYKRTNADEAPGTYEGVITAVYTDGGDYDVTVKNGDFTITPNGNTPSADDAASGSTPPNSAAPGSNVTSSEAGTTAKTGDDLGLGVTAFAFAAACSLCLALFALFRRRRQPMDGVTSGECPYCHQFIPEDPSAMSGERGPDDNARIL